jgi:MazG family protein
LARAAARWRAAGEPAAGTLAWRAYSSGRRAGAAGGTGQRPALLLTRRAEHLKDHAGQISFPGGRIEPHDQDAAQAALREADEEVGIGAADVEVLGYLDTYLTGTGFAVTPVCGAGSRPMPRRRQTLRKWLRSSRCRLPTSSIRVITGRPLAMSVARRWSSSRSPTDVIESGERQPVSSWAFTKYFLIRGLAINIEDLLEVMARLRDPEGGCPWDLEQSFATIAPYTVEEAYEVADAIERGDLEDLRGELGDLLFQVVFHARMAEEQGAFAFGDVVASIVTKMRRRHPHVFTPREDGPQNPDEVTSAWEAHKAAERRARRQQSLLSDVARALPGLKRAQKLTKRAATVGFDWPEWVSVRGKLDEELSELDDALAQAGIVPGTATATATPLSRRGRQPCARGERVW